MSPTTKPPEHLSPAEAHNLQPAAEVAAAEAAQFEAAGAAAAAAFGGEAAKVAAVVVAGRGRLPKLLDSRVFPFLYGLQGRI